MGAEAALWSLPLLSEPENICPGPPDRKLLKSPLPTGETAQDTSFQSKNKLFAYPVQSFTGYGGK
ncbi:Protein of unknown function [Pyronema omphalodes CBS 100304]|uniref:Uncharacterized protein n=1 Tax=Pyronema omphalodes (strain CBS 100304) TaxID=1076935 RepID=U4LG00_PYROM|nr:Protein of unknown function [Pyronema omphalodes CBS 100304]